MEWCHSYYSANETKQWVESRSQAWEQGKEYSFLTADAQSKQVLGTCGLNECMPDIDSPTWTLLALGEAVMDQSTSLEYDFN